MSNLDNAAATNAQSLLNGIDYGAIIGGPLQAAIKAQAMAAQSTWEFIQQVGMNTDANGNKSAVNVSFTYISGGQQVNLIVPILTIVPIPAIEITEIDIAFKANINASASQSTEQSDSSALAGTLSAEGKIGWGPFSLSANMSASYSSKKDSKATQDSRYSVEYTQDVAVKAMQAGMPAGLATILNILSNSATAVPVGSELTASPAAGQINFTDATQQQQIQLKVTDSNGVAQAGLSVTGTYQGDASLAQGVMLGSGLLPQTNAAPASSTIPPLQTAADGTVTLTAWFDASKLPATVVSGATALPNNFQLQFQATVNGQVQTINVPFLVQGALQPQISVSQPALAVAPSAQGSVTLTVKDAEGKPIPNVTVAFAQTPDGLLTVPPTLTTHTDGTVSVQLGWASGQTPAPVTVTLSATGYGQTASTSVAVTPGT